MAETKTRKNQPVEELNPEGIGSKDVSDETVVIEPLPRADEDTETPDSLTGEIDTQSVVPQLGETPDSLVAWITELQNLEQNLLPGLKPSDVVVHSQVTNEGDVTVNEGDSISNVFQDIQQNSYTIDALTKIFNYVTNNTSVSEVYAPVYNIDQSVRNLSLIHISEPTRPY